MKKFLSLILISLMAFTSFGATIQWYSQQPVTTTPRDGDVMVLETTGPQGYKSFTLLTLKTWMGTNGPSIQYITNLFIENIYGSNAYFTNVTVLNEFHGKVSFTSNSYVTNLFVTTNYNDYSFTTNLYATTEYVTNLYATTEIVTNLFISQNFTNFYLYSTNIYNADTYVSNYFTTNVFNDTYMSNFFLTNLIFYQTNLYLTQVSTTNYLSYITNQYVSNFYNTNIFVNNSYVSNYFTTNYNPLIQYISNYTFNVAWPLTNATLYGTTTFSPITGTQAGFISMQSGGVETISLAASNAAVSAKVFWFKTNSWAGPTNNLPMNLEDQYYTATGDVSITNLISLPTTGYSAGVLLSITNSAATNITWRFPSNIIIPERTNAVVISNSSKGIFSFRYSPVGPSTNGVYRQF